MSAPRKIDPSRRPERRGQWIRLALSGPQSSGKTYTSLLLAETLGSLERTLFIDTEKAGPETAASELFAERFPTYVPYLWEPPFDPRDLAATIAHYANAYDTIIVDSASHFWEDEGGTRDIADDAGRRMGGNDWAGWSEGTPAQREMVRAIEAARCHVIFCMRTKVLWELQTVQGRANTPVAVGVGAIQRNGFEFEFTLGLQLDQENRIKVSKSRIDAGGYRLEVGQEFLPARGEDGIQLNPALAREILGWVGSAVELPDAADPALVDWIRARINEAPNAVGKEARAEFRGLFGDPRRLTADTIGPAVEWTARRLGLNLPAQAAPPATEPAPTGPAAAPKGRGRAKTTGKAAKAAQGATGAADGPPGADADPGDGGEVGKDARAAIARALLSANPATATAIEQGLTDAGLWPVDSIPDDRATEAADIVVAALPKDAE